jgi:hypothetical protein
MMQAALSCPHQQRRQRMKPGIGTYVAVVAALAPRHDGEDGGFIQAFTANGKTIGFGGLSPETGERQQ